MLLSLKDFDPIKFLNVDTANLLDNEISKIRQHLNGRIGEYVILKLASNLPEDKFKKLAKVKDGKSMASNLNNLIPAFGNKVLSEVENFKKEYLETIKA